MVIEQKFEKENLIFCKGIGYPHWKQHVFVVGAVFEDETLGLTNNVRVGSEDFHHFIGDGNGNVELRELIKEKGFAYVGTQKNEKEINPAWTIPHKNLKKISQFFKNYGVWEIFRNGRSEILVTFDQIIIVNNNYDASDWGDLNGENKHVYIEISNIEYISTMDEQILLSTRQYELNFPLQDYKECHRFVKLINESKSKLSINENKTNEIIHTQ